MARWVPNPARPIGKNEPIGRRIFDDIVWRDEANQGQKGRLRVDHFYDTRVEEDLSFDRLGKQGNPDPRVVNLLKQLANAEADNERKSFEGWAYVAKRHLKKPLEDNELDIRPDDDSEENPYHALLARDDYRERRLAYFLALHLVHIFEGKGKHLAS